PKVHISKCEPLRRRCASSDGNGDSWLFQRSSAREIPNFEEYRRRSWGPRWGLPSRSSRRHGPPSPFGSGAAAFTRCASKGWRKGGSVDLHSARLPTVFKTVLGAAPVTLPNWSSRQDSNLQPRASDARALFG